MAPTIQNNAAQDKRPQRPIEKRLVVDRFNTTSINNFFN